MWAFADDPDHPGNRIWHRKKAGAIGSAVIATFSGILAAGFGFLTMTSAFYPPARSLAIITLLLALFLFALARYCWRDFRGRIGGTIILSDTGIDLDLPPYRSLTHKPPACRMTLEWGRVKTLSTRLEGYGSQGMGMMQRTWWLEPKDAPPILLFEDRAIGSTYSTPSFSGIVDEIARRGSLNVADHGTVAGRGGILGAWFTRAPAFDAPELSPAAENRLWRRVKWTGAAAGMAYLFVLVAQILSHSFG